MKILTANESTDWGRGLPNTYSTGKLPKIYWLSRQEPSTCALVIDTVESDPIAVENFNLRAVADVTEKIVRICIYGRSQVGSELLGVTQHVQATLIRTNNPRILSGERNMEERVSLSNGLVLHTLSPNMTVPIMAGEVVQLLLNGTSTSDIQ